MIDYSPPGRRQFFELSAKRAGQEGEEAGGGFRTLTYFSEEAARRGFSEPAGGMMIIRDLVSVRMQSGDQLREMVKQHGPMRDAVRFQIQVHMDPGEPLGLEVDPKTLRVRSFDRDSAIDHELHSSENEMAPQVGDIVLTIDGVEIGSQSGWFKALSLLSDKDDGRQERHVTIVFERQLPFRVDFSAGGLRVEDSSHQVWLLAPAPNGVGLLGIGEAAKALQNWHDVLQGALDEANEDDEQVMPFRRGIGVRAGGARGGTGW